MTKGKSLYPLKRKVEWDKSPKQDFWQLPIRLHCANYITASIDLIKARIKLDTTNDKKVMATLTEQKGSAWIPAKEVDLKIAVKRLGGDLDINENPLFDGFAGSGYYGFQTHRLPETH